MATRIRLARGGTHKRPFYRIVVADKRAPRDGKFIEHIGHYDPLLSENKSTLDVARAEYWLSTGAIPSERVRKLLALHGIASMARSGQSPAHKPAVAASGSAQTTAPGAAPAEGSPAEG
ncbi:MAG: 30S ribosomal protein S16 [Candidatus Lambdaproteobacteria bacterium]|nr:30S ribosomal protein S16 [Candidatus Lambdaproteobacteria bacterium]